MRKLQTRFIADISKYTENFFLGMSARQTVFGILGVLIVAAGSFILPIPSYVAVLLGFPILLFGFYKPDGLPLEEFLKCWIESKLTNPQIRYYQSDNTVYDYLWRGQINGRQVFDPKQYASEKTDTSQNKPTKGKRSMELSKTPSQKMDASASVSAASEPVQHQQSVDTSTLSRKERKELKRAEALRRREEKRARQQAALDQKTAGRAAKPVKKASRAGKNDTRTAPEIKRAGKADTSLLTALSAYEASGEITESFVTPAAAEPVSTEFISQETPSVTESFASFEEPQVQNEFIEKAASPKTDDDPFTENFDLKPQSMESESEAEEFPLLRFDGLSEAMAIREEAEDEPKWLDASSFDAEDYPVPAGAEEETVEAVSFAVPSVDAAGEEEDSVQPTSEESMEIPAIAEVSASVEDPKDIDIFAEDTAEVQPELSEEKLPDPVPEDESDAEPDADIIHAEAVDAADVEDMSEEETEPAESTIISETDEDDMAASVPEDLQKETTDEEEDADGVPVFLRLPNASVLSVEEMRLPGVSMTETILRLPPCALRTPNLRFPARVNLPEDVLRLPQTEERSAEMLRLPTMESEVVM